MKQKSSFYADELLNDGASHALASGIATTDNAYADIVKRHARLMINNGRGDWWFARVESDSESTLWVLGNATLTMRDRYAETHTPAPWKLDYVAPSKPEQSFEPVCSISAHDPEFDRDVRIADIPDPVGCGAGFRRRGGSEITV